MDGTQKYNDAEEWGTGTSKDMLMWRWGQK